MCLPPISCSSVCDRHMGSEKHFSQLHEKQGQVQWQMVAETHLGLGKTVGNFRDCGNWKVSALCGEADCYSYPTDLSPCDLRPTVTSSSILKKKTPDFRFLGGREKFLNFKYYLNVLKNKQCVGQLKMSGSHHILPFGSEDEARTTLLNTNFFMNLPAPPLASFRTSL